MLSTYASKQGEKAKKSLIFCPKIADMYRYWCHKYRVNTVLLPCCSLRPETGYINTYSFPVIYFFAN
jgi:hypothetical protein